MNYIVMLPTPSTSHVNYDRIYEPAEDSYLLLDTLASSTEKGFLQDRCDPATASPLVLEVGTGSGVVLAFVTAHAEVIFGRADITTLGTDVNPFACEATAETVRVAATGQGMAGRTPGHFCGCINGDLSTALKHGSVDVLIFNPPYVPTEALPEARSNQEPLDGSAFQAAFERDSHLLALSYAGGADGMETTKKLLGQLPDVLSKRGVAYVLLCKQNRPEDVLKRIREGPGGWNAKVVGTSGQQAGWERLCILRIWRP
ncbi:S-adenosylmethionine-dependent methyltransferase [Friedmanniomyces endolithicus]|nr:S-adenosylmethionine-dependent methyltransferase [Friedmanniomyces endolithicus]KAK0975464.1 S-adenosylmethionine-dependent methyltransferase [Friedmanniomyces endolithicus]